MQEALQHVLSLAWVNYFWCCRLNKRFLNPSTGCGPCPPPSFSHTEEFFTRFITVTDRYRQKLKSTSVLESGVKFHSSSYKHGCCSHHSYVFNHHLMAAVYTEILKVSQCVHRLYVPLVSGVYRLYVAFVPGPHTTLQFKIVLRNGHSKCL